MEKIGERIRAGRLKRELTQPQLADLAGVSRGTVSMWENCLTRPKGSNLLNLAAAIGMSPDYIITGHESKRGDAPAVRSQSGNDPALEEVSRIISGLSEEDRTLAVQLLRAFEKLEKR